MATTRMLLTTAVLAAIAALLAAPSQASFPKDEGDGLAIEASAPSVEPGTIPYLSHGIGVDESQFATPTSLGFTGDSALKVDRAVAAADKAFETYRDKTANAAREALQSPMLTGDSPLTRGNHPVGATGQATSSGNDTDWTWVGFGAGMAALLAAALAGLYLTVRHRSRVALP